MNNREIIAKVFQQLNAGPLGDKAALEISNRFISALTTAGRVIVPVEPTRGARQAGAKKLDIMTSDKEEIAREVYKAMLKE